MSAPEVDDDRHSGEGSAVTPAGPLRRLDAIDSVPAIVSDAPYRAPPDIIALVRDLFVESHGVSAITELTEWLAERAIGYRVIVISSERSPGSSA